MVVRIEAGERFDPVPGEERENREKAGQSRESGLDPKTYANVGCHDPSRSAVRFSPLIKRRQLPAARTRARPSAERRNSKLAHSSRVMSKAPADMDPA